ncbi:Hypothetical protein HVR_LOCUS1170 [uncultured virus]|nr:Hypothetical protein HVR_LOCUS1170 [uncultured virus]
MQDCCEIISDYTCYNSTSPDWDPIATIVIPIVILNLASTTLIVLLSRCVDKIFITPPPCANVNLTKNTTPDPSDSEDNSDTDADPKQEETCERSDDCHDNDPDEEPESSSQIISDQDIIEAVRKEKCLFTNNVQSSDQDLEDSSPINAITDLSGEQGSLESMAGTLISVTKNIAGVVDGAQHIPKEKKDELASLLRGVPGFISKIVDMDDNELNALLQRKSNIHKSNKDASSTEDAKKESAFLMQTLDALSNAETRIKKNN